jgi:hypothetical protein
MKRTLIVGALILAGASLALASERAANLYKTHKLALNSVLISCEDERTPRVKQLENGPFVIVTCEAPKEH